MKKICCLFICALCLSTNMQAQSVVDSVKATVRQLFFAMLEGDGTMLRDCFADNPVLQTITTNKEGKLIVRTDSLEAFVRIISTSPKGLADERIVFDMVKVDGPLATVWTPYRFYRRADFSHCGVNSFQLVRTQNKWRIQYIIDTRRKSNCVEE